MNQIFMEKYLEIYAVNSFLLKIHGKYMLLKDYVWISKVSAQKWICDLIPFSIFCLFVRKTEANRLPIHWFILSKV